MERHLSPRRLIPIQLGVNAFLSPFVYLPQFPFSVSAIIPEELLSSVSLHISLSDSSSPTIFNIHPAFSLHRLAALSDSVLTPPPVVPPHASPDRPGPAVRPVSKAPSVAPSRTHLQIWSRVSMKSALQSALATDIHQPAQPPVPPPKDPVPRLPPLAIGSIDLIGEIFSTSQFELDGDGSPGTGLQSRHERTYSAPFTPWHGIPADSMHGVQHLQDKPLHPM